MIRYQTFITRETSNSRKIIYPRFSRSPAIRKTDGDSENITETVMRRLIVEDGAWQHTDIRPQGGASIEEFPDGMIVKSTWPIIDAIIQYFSTTMRVKIDCESGTITSAP